MKLRWRIEMSTRKSKATNTSSIEGTVGGAVLAAMTPEELLAYALRLLASRRHAAFHDRLKSPTKGTRRKAPRIST